ncbi:PRC-barrel domain containing protein [Sphingomonas sp. Leaf357]|uniref:PRC-barrel domain containing protein n=1 Tax=Sphingomonas sp. Leaf357 TaxID=1736350 RepID=UPI000AB701C4|nr:PRC-barrel domain containing protein [Sphingomonas sp. Leaf357]
MIAAIMTAANLGTRITGWGFIVFMIGSVAWSTVAIGTGQTNLLWTNGFLTIVNAIGIWRWLGREARHEDGREAATAHSAESTDVATLFGMGSIVGAPLTGRGGGRLGTIVDGMMRCDNRDLAYLVVSEGGMAGLGERLHALDPSAVHFSPAGARCDLTASDLQELAILEQGEWPAEIPKTRLDVRR